MIKGIHHVALKCDGKEKFKEVIHFYHEILGLPILREWNGGIMLDVGNSILEIFEEGQTLNTTGSVNHFAFALEDVDTCIEIIRKEGYTVTVEPKDICIPSKIPFPARIAFCIGPVGEEIELFNEK